jgi:hypothetical protein
VDGVGESPEDLLLAAQRELDRQQQEALLLAAQAEARAMQQKFLDADFLVHDLQLASARKAKETAALVASLAAKEQEIVALAASLLQREQTLTNERRESSEAKTAAAQSHKNFEELLIEEAAKDKQQLQASLSKEKRQMQARAEVEQKRWQGLLVQAKKETAQVELEAAEERSVRQRIEQEATQTRSERARIEQELEGARDFAAVSVLERVLSLPDVELRALEEAARGESMRRQLQRGLEREVQRALERERESVREARLCEICLDNPKDVALSCGHQACADCAEGLVNCHICRQIITARTRLYF